MRTRYISTGSQHSVSLSACAALPGRGEQTAKQLLLASDGRSTPRRQCLTGPFTHSFVAARLNPAVNFRYPASPSSFLLDASPTDATGVAAEQKIWEIMIENVLQVRQVRLISASSFRACIAILSVCPAVTPVMHHITDQNIELWHSP